MKKDCIHIYTDGACQGNPGPGGWGVFLHYNGHEKNLSGAMADTTNNQMELMAAIKGLEAIQRSVPICLYTDSQYVKKGMTEWLSGWKANNWRTSQKKTVKNKDLWIQLDNLAAPLDITWKWVKGHAGDYGNERADALARSAIQ